MTSVSFQGCGLLPKAAYSAGILFGLDIASFT